MPQDEQSTEVLLKNADVATYNVKKSGPGHLQFFTPALQKKALERGEFALRTNPM